MPSPNPTPIPNVEYTFPHPMYKAPKVGRDPVPLCRDAVGAFSLGAYADPGRQEAKQPRSPWGSSLEAER